MRGFAPGLVGAVLGLGAATTVSAQDGVYLSGRVATLTAGLFCAPPEGGRRPAPDTMAGWIHVPAEPVQMIVEGREAPAVLGLGFGVRYRLADGDAARTRYTVTHPPMPPRGTTTQSWDGAVSPGETDTVFFQFDIPEELQPGQWTFAVEADGETLLRISFTVRPPADLPALADLCRGGTLLSLSPSGHAAAG